jgi:two-component system cell cycle response regulator
MSKILVVEDDFEMNNYVALTLRMEGYEILQAHDGVKALAEAKSFQPDLILSDMEMPHMGGLALAQELQKDPTTSTSPLIFVTGRHELESRVRGLEYSVDYIVKPFATPELVARVRAALRIRNLEKDLRAANDEMAKMNEQLAKANAQLEQLAMTDELTNVCNRRGFEKYLEDELYRTRRLGTPLALVMFDLDHFKLINDTWGHAQGDVVLQEFSQLLRASSRHIDTVARFGGEEFVVVLPATDEEGALNFAEKARAATAAREIARVTGDAEILSPLRVTVSGGAAIIECLQNDNIGPEVLMQGMVQCADRCLYEAKQGGRNRVVVQTVLESEVERLGQAAGDATSGASSETPRS